MDKPCCWCRINSVFFSGHHFCWIFKFPILSHFSEADSNQDKYKIESLSLSSIRLTICKYRKFPRAVPHRSQFKCKNTAFEFASRHCPSPFVRHLSLLSSHVRFQVDKTMGGEVEGVPITDSWVSLRLSRCLMCGAKI